MEQEAVPQARPGGPGPLARLLDALACPVCGGDLAFAGGSLRCAAQHTFDIARQGYASLLTGDARAASGDTAPMVEARAEFLRAGHYAPLARLLADAFSGLAPEGPLLDAGVGTGYYLAALLDARPEAVGLGLDSSKFALRRAARAHPRAGAAACDLWRGLPVRTGSIGAVLNVFSPRNAAEFHRVLRGGGALVVARPTSRHLIEPRRELGLLSVDESKDQRLERAMSGYFRLDREEPLEFSMALSVQEVENAVLMGPSAHHVNTEELGRRLSALDAPMGATASFRVAVFRPE